MARASLDLQQPSAVANKWMIWVVLIRQPKAWDDARLEVEIHHPVFGYHAAYQVVNYHKGLDCAKSCVDTIVDDIAQHGLIVTDDDRFAIVCLVDDLVWLIDRL